MAKMTNLDRRLEDEDRRQPGRQRDASSLVSCEFEGQNTTLETTVPRRRMPEETAEGQRDLEQR